MRTVNNGAEHSPHPLVSEFDEKVGLKYLRGMHLNDSKVDVGSKRDRHENIGLYVFIPLQWRLTYLLNLAEVSLESEHLLTF